MKDVKSQLGRSKDRTNGARRSGRPRKNDRAQVGIQSVDTVLEVLDALVRRGRSMGLSELARETGLAPNKLHRYLVSLARHGMLAQSPTSGLYDLGAAVRRMGVAAWHRFDEMAAVHECVTELSAATGYDAGLYVWTDLGPTLIRFVNGIDPMPITIKPGSALPLCSSATGRVFLAHLPERTTRPFLRREMAQTEGDHVSGHKPARLASLIEEIRSYDIYCTTDAIIPGGIAVAPIFSSRHDLLCAIVLVMPPGTMANKNGAAAISRMRKDVKRLSSLLADSLPSAHYRPGPVEEPSE